MCPKKTKKEKKKQLPEASKSKNLNKGHWNTRECRLFLEAIKKKTFIKAMEQGRPRWAFVANHVKTRTVTQVRSHAQKYFYTIQSSTDKITVNKSNANTNTLTDKVLELFTSSSNYSLAINQWEGKVGIKAVGPRTVKYIPKVSHNSSPQFFPNLQFEQREESEEIDISRENNEDIMSFEKESRPRLPSEMCDMFN